MAGYERDTTPQLAERIASRRDATYYSNCYSHANWTLPSSGSILTGTWPSHHRIGFGNDMVPEQLDTVPELLSEVGYRTVGISDMAHVSSTYGFDRGFDAFYGPDTRTVPDLSSKLGLLQYPAIVTEGLRQAIWNADAARDGYPLLKTVPLLTNEVIKREVKRATARDRNYFIYAHCISPHNPYEPPAGFADQFLKNAGLDREAALETSQKWLSSRDSLHEISANEARLTNNQWEQLIALYDGELNWVDRYVSQLLDALSPIPEDTVVIVTSDHGELLGERGIATHKFLLTDSVTNVPLLVFNDDRLPIREETAFVQHIDLMQTLLDDAGADTEQFKGVNLAREPRTRVFAQRKDYTEIFEEYPHHDMSKYHTGQVNAIRCEEFKLLDGDNRQTLYNIPDEETDVSEAHPDVTAQLESELEDWRATIGNGIEIEATADLTDKVKYQLERLGYK